MQAWESFLKQQEAELGAETVKKWLRSLKVQRFDARNIYLEAKDSFQALWFEEHIRAKVQSQLLNGNQGKIKVHVAIANAPETPKKEKPRTKKREYKAPPFDLIFDELDPHSSFDNFIVDEENKVTLQLLTEIAGASRTKQGARLGSFNPLYLYGNKGSGKSHLLMSLAHVFRSQGLKTIYVRANTFTDHVVSAIRAGEMSLFRQAYRNIDILIIDDVHIFSRKGATQEEFFHTFNTLHLESKQIILSANCAPQQLQLIEPRLISRFEWGIVLPIKPLKDDSREKLLLAKAAALQFSIPPHITEFLTETFVCNSKSLVKALEALVLRLHLDSSHQAISLTIPGIKSLLSDLILEEQQTCITPSKVIQAVAEQYGICSEDILSKGQSRDCVLPRQMAMYVCRQELKLPYMQIGDVFSRDHSTVMSSIKQIQKAIDQNDPEIPHTIQSVLKKLQNQ